MNFDEYKWNWDAQSTQQSEYTYDDNQLQRLGPYSEISNLSKDLGTCIGQGCCSNGTTIDTTQNMCIK